MATNKQPLPSILRNTTPPLVNQRVFKNPQDNEEELQRITEANKKQSAAPVDGQALPSIPPQKYTNLLLKSEQALSGNGNSKIASNQLLTIHKDCSLDKNSQCQQRTVKFHSAAASKISNLLEDTEEALATKTPQKENFDSTRTYSAGQVSASASGGEGDHRRIDVNKAQNSNPNQPALNIAINDAADTVASTGVRKESETTVVSTSSPLSRTGSQQDLIPAIQSAGTQKQAMSSAVPTAQTSDLMVPTTKPRHFDETMLNLKFPARHLSRLPPNAAIATYQTDPLPQSLTAEMRALTPRPNLMEFVDDALDTARSFFTRNFPGTSEPKVSRRWWFVNRTYHTEGQVVRSYLMKRKARDAKDIIKSMAARESLHECKQAADTATFEELQRVLLIDHSEKEQAYTPNVKSHKVCEWSDIPSTTNWVNPRMSLHENCHKMPSGLHDRVFTVLVITGSVAHQSDPCSPASCYVLTIPIERPDLLVRSAPFEYTNKSRGVVHAAYTAMEMVQQITIENRNSMKWIMATDSDAKGMLPKVLQNLGVCGKIAKDVGLIIRWIANRARSVEAPKE